MFDGSDPQDTAECWVLREAARIVRQGWCQGAVNYGDQFCTMGAMYYALRDEPDASLIVETVDRAIGRLLQYVNYGGSIGGWNDTPGRTAEEVALALEAAARS